MKKIFILPVVFLFFAFSYFKNSTTDCKKWAGIYKTFSNYTQKQYSDSVCLDIKGNSVYQGSLYNLILKSNRQKTTFNPGEVYGYFDGENTFRYFETNGAMSPYGFFLIKDTSGLIIYSQKHHSYRHSSTGYYYSKTMNDTIKILNIKNLETDFANMTFLAEVKGLVESLKNKNTEKAMVSIREINAIYKKHNR